MSERGRTLQSLLILLLAGLTCAPRAAFTQPVLCECGCPEERGPSEESADDLEIQLVVRQESVRVTPTSSCGNRFRTALPKVARSDARSLLTSVPLDRSHWILPGLLASLRL